ncbi:MAG: hypothetical protein AAFV62_13435, partial [Pseudomonadota bacterium]
MSRAVAAEAATTKSTTKRKPAEATTTRAEATVALRSARKGLLPRSRRAMPPAPALQPSAKAT